MRVVEAFVKSGGNAILRTADGNIISSGLGSGLTSFSSSNEAFMGSMITVGSSGQVSVTSASSAFVKVKSQQGMRAVVSSRGSKRIYIGGTGHGTQLGGGSTRLKVIRTSYSSSGKVIISSVGVSGGSGGAGGVSGGSGGTGGASGGSGGAGGASGGSGSASGGGGASGGSGGIVTGATVLGSAASMGADGAVKSYGSGINGWTLLGATTNNAQEVKVIGDFGGESRSVSSISQPLFMKSLSYLLLSNIKSSGCLI